MPLGFEEKKAIVADVSETARHALSLVIADARGVNVGDINALRKQAREHDVHLRVIKNTLARRAFAGTDYECVVDVLTGPSLFGFSMENPGACARLFKDFAKNNEQFDIKALAVGGQMMGAEKIDVLATLPTRDEALGMLAATLIAPVTKLTRTLNEFPSQITRVVHAAAVSRQEAA